MIEILKLFIVMGSVAGTIALVYVLVLLFEVLTGSSKQDLKDEGLI